MSDFTKMKNPSVFQRLVTVADALDSLIRSSLGPFGADKMLVSSANSLLLTNSANAILQSVSSSLEDPLARFILASVDKFAHTHGDGCASFLVSLNAAVQKMVSLLGGMPSKRTWEVARRREALTKLSNGLYRIRRLLDKNIYDTWSMWSLHHDTSSDDLKRQTKYVLRTHLAGTYNCGTTLQLCNLIVQWLWYTNNLGKSKCTGAALLEKFRHSIHGITSVGDNLLIIEAAGKSLDKSRPVGDGVLLSRSFVRPQLKPRQPTSELQSVHFIVLSCSLDWAQHCSDDNKVEGTSDFATVEVQDRHGYNRAISFESARIKRSLDILFFRGVRLIVSTRKLSDIVATACEERGMRAVGFVEEEEAHLLCQHGKLYSGPLQDASAKALYNAPLAEAAEVSLYVLGGKQHVYIKSIRSVDKEKEKEKSDSLFCQLLLRAPTSGLLKQYALSIRRALRLLRSWSEDPDLLLVAGAGAFEAKMHHFFNTQKIRKRKIENEKLRWNFHAACDILATGCTAPAMALAQNAVANHAYLKQKKLVSRVQNEKTNRKTLLFFNSLLQSHHDENSSMGLVAVPFSTSDQSIRSELARTVLKDAAISGVVEPLQIKIKAVQLLIDLLEQITRIDSILLVKKGIRFK
eukprot:g5388.t1